MERLVVPIRLFNSYESLICLSIWVVTLSFVLQRLSVVSKENLSYLDLNNLSNGWLFKTPKDSADYEWFTFTELFRQCYHYVLLHLFMSIITRRFNNRATAYVWILIGSVVLCDILSPIGFLTIIVLILLSFLVSKCDSILLQYTMFTTTLIFVHKDPFFDFKTTLFGSDERRIFLFELVSAWIAAKSLSFSIDLFRIRKSWSFFVDFLAYCLYLPTLFTGPIHIFALFTQDLSYPRKPPVRLLIKDVFRLLIWILLLELIQHLIYSTSILYEYDLVAQFDDWTLAGFGLSLPLLFYLKYSILYGFARFLGTIDCIDLPQPPKCVFRTHLSSNLWRYFDQGLYHWLTRYFYKPLIRAIQSPWSSLFSSGFCFTYVWLWHGMSKAVICWCSLNFLCVSMESFGLKLRNWLIGDYFASISQLNQQRFKSFIGAPFFALMIISNIFFLSSYEIGLLFLKRFMFTFPYPFIPLMIVMYSACFASIELIAIH